MGETRLTLWRDGEVVSRVDSATGDAEVEGRGLRYQPPKPVPLEHVDFDFSKDLQGWVAQSGLGPLVTRDGALQADIVGEDPYMSAPAISLAADSIKTIVVRMSVTCGRFGQFYFSAEGANAGAEEMCIHFDVVPDGQMRDVRINVGDHPLWRGRRIVGLRLDPEHGESPGKLVIEFHPRGMSREVGERRSAHCCASLPRLTIREVTTRVCPQARPALSE